MVLFSCEEGKTAGESNVRKAAGRRGASLLKKVDSLPIPPLADDVRELAAPGWKMLYF